MATCPSGHESASDDFCDVCGYLIGAPPSFGPSQARSSQPAEATGGATPAAAQPMSPGPVPPGTPGTAGAGTEWTAVVTADRAYYDSVQAEGGPDAPGITFPAFYPERRFRLSGPEIRIGRRSAHSGIDPEIDLAIPPADPGVSRLHAVLIRAADGTWSVIDPGSANGTLVNGREIASDQAVPLHDGDRLHLGAWTQVTIRRA